MKQALEDSIKHWEENLELAKVNSLDRTHIMGSGCALCSDCEDIATEDAEGADFCQFCPLFEAGYECNSFEDDEDISPWEKVLYAVDTKDGTVEKRTIEMLNILKGLRDV